MKRMLFAAVLVSLSAITAWPAEKDDVAKRLCVLSAAQRLPAIPGLTIVASEARPEQKNQKAGDTVSRIVVDIKINAAGVDATYEFICLPSGDKPPIIQPLGMR